MNYKTALYLELSSIKLSKPSQESIRNGLPDNKLDRTGYRSRPIFHLCGAPELPHTGVSEEDFRNGYGFILTSFGSCALTYS